MRVPIQVQSELGIKAFPGQVLMVRPAALFFNASPPAFISWARKPFALSLHHSWHVGNPSPRAACASLASLSRVASYGKPGTGCNARRGNMVQSRPAGEV